MQKIFAFKALFQREISPTTSRKLAPTWWLFLKLRVLGLLAIFPIALFAFALLPVPLWFFHLGVGAPAGALVVVPPRVSERRGAVHGSLHVTEIGLPVLAGSIAAPPVLTIHIHFVMEAVVDLR